MLVNYHDICWHGQFFTQPLLTKFMFADFATCIIVCPEWIYNGQTSHTLHYIKHVLTVLWYLLQVWLSQNPTCLAMCSSVTRDASTCVRIDSVGTSCPIHTRAATAFVNIYKSNVTFWHVNKKQLITTQFVVSYYNSGFICSRTNTDGLIRDDQC